MLATTSFQAASTCWALTFSTVECCPAKVASESSQVALERTLTRTSGPKSPASSSMSRAMPRESSSGRGAAMIMAWISSLMAMSISVSFTSMPFMRRSMRSARPVVLRKCWQAYALTAKPRGVGSPARLATSPRLAALPPTSSASSAERARMGRMSSPFLMRLRCTRSLSTVTPMRSVASNRPGYLPPDRAFRSSARSYTRLMRSSLSVSTSSRVKGLFS